jgi:hypothetical protein
VNRRGRLTAGPSPLHWAAAATCSKGLAAASLPIVVWAEAFPAAIAWASPRVRERARARHVDIEFTRDLDAIPPEEWQREIDQTLFPGGYFKEFIFFHKASKTLILTDTIINIELDKLTEPWRTATKLTGMYHPHRSAEPAADSARARRFGSTQGRRLTTPLRRSVQAPRMAASGQTRPCRDVRDMSVLPSISAVMSRSRDRQLASCGRGESGRVFRCPWCIVLKCSLHSAHIDSHGAYP